MPEISQLTADIPLLLRVAVGLIGGLLIVAGARWYHFGLYLAAFATGAGLFATVLAALSTQLPLVADPMVMGIGSVIAGLVLAWGARVAHRMAMLGAGAFTGFVAGVAAVDLLAVPMWVAAVTMLVGALVFPWVYEQLLKVLTPAVGAACVAWAVGMADQPALLGGLWAFGTVVQFVGERASPPPEPEDDEE